MEKVNEIDGEGKTSSLHKKTLGKYSIGIGDRFGLEAGAQLRAILQARNAGVLVTPVWNKSYREHQIIGSIPEITRQRADEAVAELSWKFPYFVDADHITFSTVELFINCCDFFTLDVANFIGKQATHEQIHEFIEANEKYVGEISLPGVAGKIFVNEKLLEKIAEKYLGAVTEAGRIYRFIAEASDDRSFVVEISLDEAETAQRPVELLFILSAIAREKIPLNTIAPRFSGRFNKGIDYSGYPAQFAREFELDLAVIEFAKGDFTLPPDLKLSVHSGSDKFSLYPFIRESMRKFDAGIHLKTAGTTWLAELAGLAESGQEGLRIAKEIYGRSLREFADLCAPYSRVINIDQRSLPTRKEVNSWTGRQFAAALDHNQENEHFNSNFRQLLHVAYKIAADLGGEYIAAIQNNREIISRKVTENLFERHIKPLFLF